jgi:cardiolipin synthase
LSENRNPVKSLAWVTVLLMVPLFGMVLYIFFGRSLKNTRMVSRGTRRRLRRHAAAAHISHPLHSSVPTLGTASRQVSAMLSSMTNAQVTGGNYIDIFTDGSSKFETMLADIDAAKHYILLQYYIFEDDTCGRRLAEKLKAKARSGVSVRVIYDHLGSVHTSRRFWREMREAGVEVFPFFRVTMPLFVSRLNWRNHRKIVVVDGIIGYIGGMNIADRYMTASWRDTHIRFTGPAVTALQYSFTVDWCFMGQPMIEDTPSASDWPVITTPSNDAIQILTGGPTGHWSNLSMAFTRAIGIATERVYIQTPYFLPNDSMLRILQACAMSHVDVRLMLPRRSDSRILTLASNSYIQECLQAGIKVYLYGPGMLHAKTLIIDNEIASVGSTNIDFRSFEHNFEANAFIYSRSFNSRLAKTFINDIAHATRITTAEWKRRPLMQKIGESVVRLLSPIL